MSPLMASEREMENKIQVYFFGLCYFDYFGSFSFCDMASSSSNLAQSVASTSASKSARPLALTALQVPSRLGGFRGGYCCALCFLLACQFFLIIFLFPFLSFSSIHYCRILGFFMGLAVAGGAGYYLLLGDYDISARLLQGKVDQIQTSTEEVCSLPLFVLLIP